MPQLCSLTFCVICVFYSLNPFHPEWAALKFLIIGISDDSSSNTFCYSKPCWIFTVEYRFNVVNCPSSYNTFHLEEYFGIKIATSDSLQFLFTWYVFLFLSNCLSLIILSVSIFEQDLFALTLYAGMKNFFYYTSLFTFVTVNGLSYHLICNDWVYYVVFTEFIWSTSKGLCVIVY